MPSGDTLRVNYINLQNSFKQMMKQYKELEDKIADKDVEILRLKEIISLQRMELKRLGDMQK